MVQANALKSVPHGGFAKATCFDIKQHDYAGGGPDEGGAGYIEVLEIVDAPQGYQPVVINEHSESVSVGGTKNCFSEWKSLADARAAFKAFWGSTDTAERFAKLPGFIRYVKCEDEQPWFYASGMERIQRDFSF